MLRLQKMKQLDRLSETERKSLDAEINSSQRLCKLLSDILQEKIDHYESTYESLLESHTGLSGAIQCVAELKRLKRLFETTTKE